MTSLSLSLTRLSSIKKAHRRPSERDGPSVHIYERSIFDLMAGPYSTDMSRRRSHQKLPSFRELLPPHLHEEIEANSVPVSPGSLQVTPASISDIDQRSSASSVTPSPLSEHPKMPSVAAGFDEFAGRYAESIPPLNNPNVQNHLRYHKSGQMGPPASASRPGEPTSSYDFLLANPDSPVLPPLRSIESLPDRSVRDLDRHGRIHNEYNSHNRLDGHSGSGDDLRSLQHSHRRPSLYETGQRGHQTYPFYQDVSERRTSDYMKLDSYSYDNSTRQLSYGEPYGLEDHALRTMSSQHAGFGMLGDVVESRSKRRRGNLPKPVTDILKQWFHEHLDHPYPSEEDKQMFIARTGLSISQISNWFINARRRQLPALRNQLRSHDQGQSSHHQTLSDTDRVSSQGSSVSPR